MWRSGPEQGSAKDVHSVFPPLSLHTVYGHAATPTHLHTVWATSTRPRPLIYIPPGLLLRLQQQSCGAAAETLQARSLECVLSPCVGRVHHQPWSSEVKVKAT